MIFTENTKLCPWFCTHKLFFSTQRKFCWMLLCKEQYCRYVKNHLTRLRLTASVFCIKSSQLPLNFQKSKFDFLYLFDGFMLNKPTNFGCNQIFLHKFFKTSFAILQWELCKQPTYGKLNENDSLFFWGKIYFWDLFEISFLGKFKWLLWHFGSTKNSNFD
jgi:hypothetical protein